MCVPMPKSTRDPRGPMHSSRQRRHAASAALQVMSWGTAQHCVLRCVHTVLHACGAAYMRRCIHAYVRRCMRTALRVCGAMYASCCVRTGLAALYPRDCIARRYGWPIYVLNCPPQAFSFQAKIYLWPTPEMWSLTMDRKPCLV